MLRLTTAFLPHVTDLLSLPCDALLVACLRKSDNYIKSVNALYSYWVSVAKASLIVNVVMCGSIPGIVPTEWLQQSTLGSLCKRISNIFI